MTDDKIITILISVAALLLSLYNFHISRTATLYQDLDRLYLEVLKTGMANPDFVNPELTGDYSNKFKDDKKRQYELYAYMVWNICETIYDRRRNKAFFRTWKCVIKREKKLHGNWFSQESNQQGFKDKFVQYVYKHFPTKN